VVLKIKRQHETQFSKSSYLRQADNHDPASPVPLPCNSSALAAGRPGNPLTEPVSMTILYNHHSYKIKKPKKFQA